MNNKEIKAYHGSGVSIQAFDYAFTDQGNDQLGSGFYFTTSAHEARAYCFNQLNGKPKLGGSNNPTVHHVVLDIKNPIKPSDQRLFTRQQVAKIIQSSPVLEEQIESNWGEIAFEGLPKLINEAIDSYDYQESTNVIKFLNSISKDFYPGHQAAFFQVINQLFGYDGVQTQFVGKDSWVNHEHYVAWFPEQINILHRQSLIDELCEAPASEDPDIVEEMPLFHGGELEDLTSIMENGLDIDRSSLGYFGKGFYCATDIQLSISNYANMADDPAVIVLQLKRGARILDLRNENDWAYYQENNINRLQSRDDLPALMRSMKIDGLYDRSFGGVVIYNEAAVQVVGLAKLPKKPSAQFK